ncbi:MAG: ABC transporter permease [Chloroflexi bacterium]|nr:ABC transporter permease [Chloroflexota bacterium]
MLFRILREALGRRRRRVALALLSILLASALATALLSLSTSVLERISQELRAYGANILVTPHSEEVRLEIGGISYTPPTQQPLLDEKELVKLKTIFWRNNIRGFAPFLNLVANVQGEATVITGTWFERRFTLSRGTQVSTTVDQTAAVGASQEFTAGVRGISPWWRVEGQWPADSVDGDSAATQAPSTSSGQALVGSAVAKKLGLKPGDRLVVEYLGQARTLEVAGLLHTGGLEEQQVFVPLELAQGMAGLERGTSRVLVSALVLPEEKLAQDLRGKSPEEMTPEQYEVWYCSPIMGAVLRQIEEALPGAQAQPILQVSQAEAAFASRIQFMALIITVVALAASSLAVMTTMTTLVLERRREIAIMKAIGADNGQVAALFLAEAGALGLLGGLLGYGLGLVLARLLGVWVFGRGLPVDMELLPLVLLLAWAVAFLGSLGPLRQAIGTPPVHALRNN